MEQKREQGQGLNKTKPLLISCGILQPEIDRLISQDEISAEVIFLNKYLHMDYSKLNQVLKASLKKHQDRKTVVVYGDVCLGFHNEMQTLIDEFGSVKVKALNCIDCLLGGSGKLLEIDPDHVYIFLTPGFIDFFESLLTGSKVENRQLFHMLQGILVIDSLGNAGQYQKRIESLSDQIGLPVLEYKPVGLHGLKAVIQEAVSRI
jgi:hypothetical protein